MAAELRDTIGSDMAKLYPSLDGMSSVTIVDVGAHLLRTYDPKISTYTEDQFEGTGWSIIP